MTRGQKTILALLAWAAGFLAILVMLAYNAQADTRWTVAIDGGPNVCIIDRNDAVRFFNDRAEPVTVVLPGIGGLPPVFEFYLLPGETSNGVRWNLDHVDAAFEVDGVVVVTVRTTDGPTSCAAWYRITVGGITSD